MARIAGVDLPPKKRSEIGLTYIYGVGRSRWLNANDEAGKRAAAAMDWSFMVWQQESWKQLRRLRADINPTDPQDADGQLGHGQDIA